MGALSIKQTASVVGLAAIVLIVLLPNRATAESRPQEVLDLISAHEALAMKIRPLQDRVLAAPPATESSAEFKTEGVPLRAKTSTTNGESNTENESRVPETLRHKDRAATSGDDYGRIKVKFSTLEKNASKERERINRPDFGVSLANHDGESNVDAKAIADARKTLAALQQELSTLEREVSALGRR
jgi:hypothetical protein